MKIYTPKPKTKIDSKVNAGVSALLSIYYLSCEGSWQVAIIIFGIAFVLFTIANKVYNKREKIY